MKNKIITIFGAGFIAKNLIFELLKENYAIRVVCRNPNLVGNLRSMANIEQLEICHGNILNKASIENYIKNTDFIINTVGILSESGNQNFHNCHILGPKNISKFAKQYQVKKLIHISSLGADRKSSVKYQSSKGQGEEETKKNFPKAIIVRPSIVFGSEDSFFNMQAKLVKLSPVIPLFNGGKNKFQCVFVNDLSLGIKKILQSESSEGLTFEFGGPDIMTMKEVYELVISALNINRIFVPVPISIASLMGLIMQIMPSPLITYDQVKMLKLDNIVTEKNNTLISLGIDPKSAKDIVPSYIK